MPDPGQARLFELAETVTVYVLGPDGMLLDVIEEVDLGDRLEASRAGRTSLHQAALWADLAGRRYRQLHPLRRGDAATPTRSSGREPDR
jgi:hypothetical protein